MLRLRCKLSLLRFSKLNFKQECCKKITNLQIPNGKGVFSFSSGKSLESNSNNIATKPDEKFIPISINKIEEEYESLVYFQVLQNIFYKHFNLQVQETKPERSAVLQREIGLRSTLSQRVFGDIDITFRAELEKFIVSWDKSYSELKRYFEERYVENRLTMHPTEG